MAVDDKYVGLILALSSSLLIGASYIITKKGLIASRSHHSGGGTDSYGYLSNSLWWVGMIVMVGGELANFAAYSFAPAILVTPLGALSVLISALLAQFFLGEQLGRDGIIGSALSLIGSLIIILHAPEEKKVESINEMLQYALQPGFLIYMILSTSISVLLIYHYAPKYGKRNPLVYISICSLVGSITVMACKAFGIALKLTFSGNNQFVYPSTYLFIIVVVTCIVTQMNYFNKALDLFSTNIVTPIYYVFFTTATISASVILFQGISDTSGNDLTSIFCGFLTIFIGVFLLNTPKTAGGNQRSRANSRSHHSSALDIIKSPFVSTYGQNPDRFQTLKDDVDFLEDEEDANLNGVGKLYTNGLAVTGLNDIDNISYNNDEDDELVIGDDGLLIVRHEVPLKQSDSENTSRNDSRNDSRSPLRPQR
ncbi:hypothetical protein MP228_002982 [Amoeboaphelidium protococcarum]|nr:hypothetical protein MP228_002982 [Amoeboaphelidium protococcarum]